MIKCSGGGGIVLVKNGCREIGMGKFFGVSSWIKLIYCGKFIEDYGNRVCFLCYNVEVGCFGCGWLWLFLVYELMLLLLFVFEFFFYIVFVGFFFIVCF